MTKQHSRNKSPQKEPPKGSKVPFYKNPTLLGTTTLISFLLAIISILLAIHFGISSSNFQQELKEAQLEILPLQQKNNEFQLEILTLQQENNEFQQEILSLQQEIREAIIQEMNYINNTQSGTLIQSYPVGYQIFSIAENQVILGPIQQLEDYEIQWNTVEVVGLTTDTITIRLPDIYYKPNNIKFSGNVIGISRSSVGQKHIPFDIFPDELYIKILEDTGYKIIFVIGLEPRN
jgi:hypothetical protein